MLVAGVEFRHFVRSSVALILADALCGIKLDGGLKPLELEGSCAAVDQI
jgi:hypothetical protein